MEIIGGNVGKAEVKQTKAGKDFLSFSVAESVGMAESKVTTWYDCTMWQGDAQGIEKGARVIVFGNSSEREYEGKVYKQFNVFKVEVLA